MIRIFLSYKKDLLYESGFWHDLTSFFCDDDSLAFVWFSKGLRRYFSDWREVCFLKKMLNRFAFMIYELIIVRFKHITLYFWNTLNICFSDLSNLSRKNFWNSVADYFGSFFLAKHSFLNSANPILCVIIQIESELESVKLPFQLSK